MDYQFTRRPKAARLSLALSSKLHDSVTDKHRGILKSGVNRDRSSSKSTGFPKRPSSSNTSNPSSWVAPESWALDTKHHKPKLAPLRGPNVKVPSSGEATPIIIEEHLHSMNIPYLTEHSSMVTLIPEEMLERSTRSEKATRLKRLYRRASGSAKAFAKMLSLSSSNRSSFIPPVPPLPASVIDQFSESSSISSYGLSPSPPIAHKRNGSTPPDEKVKMSIDFQTSVKRSFSVSSPMGVPSPPLIARFIHPPHKGVRGRDLPFPVNPSVVSLPSTSRRPRSISEESISTDGGHSTVSRQTHTNPDRTTASVSTIIPSSRVTLRARATPPPQMPLPLTPRSASALGAASPTPAPASVQVSTTVQRARSASVREFEPVRYSEDSTTEAIPQRPPKQQQRRLSPTDRNETKNNDANSAALEVSPAGGSQSESDTGKAPPYGTTVVDDHMQKGVQVVAPVPSNLPSVTGAFLDWDASKMRESGIGTQENRRTVSRQRASSVREIGKRASASTPNLLLASKSVQRQTAEVATPTSTPAPLPSSVIDGLSERLAQSRHRDSPPGRTPTPSREHGHPSPRTRPPALPPLFTPRSLEPPVQNDTGEEGHPHPLPHFPSLPSIKANLITPPPTSRLPPRINSHYEEPKTRVGILKGSAHVRSPSLPTFPSIDKASARQPLPPGIAERLRERASSAPKTEDARGLPLPESRPTSSRKSSLDTVSRQPPSSRSPPREYPTHLRNSPRHIPQAEANVSDFHASPSPSISRLLRSRAKQLRQSELDNNKFRSPSLPDLHLEVSVPPPPYPVPQTQIRRTRSPPHPLPQVRTSPIPFMSLPPSQTVAAAPGRTSSSSSRSDSPPFITVLRDKLSGDNTPQFHARSNRELAKEGGWDFLDTPLRPPRSPLVTIPATPITPVHQKSHSFGQALEVVSSSQSASDDSDESLEMPSDHWDRAAEWVVGKAL